MRVCSLHVALSIPMPPQQEQVSASHCHGALWRCKQVFDLGADGKELKKVAEVPDLIRQAERAAGVHLPHNCFLLLLLHTSMPPAVLAFVSAEREAPDHASPTRSLDLTYLEYRRCAEHISYMCRVFQPCLSCLGARNAGVRCGIGSVDSSPDAPGSPYSVLL